MYGQVPQNINNRLTIEDIEKKIRNNQYKTKDELADEILELRRKGLINIDNKKISELLSLFDSLHTKEITELDLSNYSSASLEEDLIISKQDDRILTTLEGQSAFVDEFKQNQNELIANNKEKNVDADDVFQKMANQEKTELSLLTLEEALLNQNISTELLSKIRFFITHINMNPSIFRVNIETGIFYNIENNEAYEVRKNIDTLEYEIYQGANKVYSQVEKEHEEVLEDKDEQQISYDKPKTRVRTPNNNPYMKNAAFTKIGFLTMNIITFILMIIMTILLIK